MTAKVDSTVVVVDDDAVFGEFVREALVGRGFSVDVMTSADAALARCGQASPAILLLDLQMPGVDGIEVLRALAERNCTSRIVLVSGVDPRVLRTARRLGQDMGLDMADALQKPVTLAAIEGVVGRSEAADFDPSRETLLRAIQAGEFLLYYQPQVRLDTRQIRGVESLVRWKHPSRGLLQPAEFLPALARAGLMSPLARLLLQRGCRQAAAWQRAGVDLRLSFNVSADVLADLMLPDWVSEAGRASGTDLSRLAIEITETAAMEDPLGVADTLSRLRIRGVAVSVDDFGTGYSCLRWLQKLPFTELKIDCSFVLELCSDPDSAKIVRSIIGLGHDLGLSICAEGIEDRQTWERLASLGCDFGQGYWIARPFPPEAFATWAAGWTSRSEAGHNEALAAPMERQRIDDR